MNPPAVPPLRRERLAWIDVFRGAAVLVMIETHVVNTFLAAPLRAENWFGVLNYLNGLVAPSFLFIAGFVQGMERRTSPGKAINYRRRAGRLLGLLVLGYALHIPWMEIAGHRWDDALRTGTQVDVLQCLAASLALLLGVTWLAEKVGRPGRSSGTEPPMASGPDAALGAPWHARGQMVWWIGVAGLALAAVLVAPASVAWLGWPVPVQAWLNRSTGSWFPLPSWAAFVFLGALMGAWPRRPALERAAGILALVVLAWACRGAEYSSLSPASFFERAACVLVLAAFCEWRATRTVPPVPLFAGNHSLTLYVTHLLLISWLVGAGVPVITASLPATFALLAGVGLASLWITRWISKRPQGWFAGRLAPAAVAPEAR